MSGLVRRLRGEYDIVLIDTPPMAVLSDARVLASLSDGNVLLVFRAGKTTRESAFAAQHCFRQDGIPILGTVLNRLEFAEIKSARAPIFKAVRVRPKASEKT